MTLVPPIRFRIIALLLLSAATIGLNSSVSSTARRPNIVLILADDLGFSDLGCYGSRIETPNLDRLAQEGLRFTQFYNAARCCPTRAALLSGLYPHQAGVGHMTQNWTQYGAAYSPGLNQQCTTMAELLHEAGYRNYLSGKWHVGGMAEGQEQNFPTSRGFDHFYGTYGGGNFFAPDNLYLGRQRIQPAGDYYFTDAVTDYAVKYLDEHQREHTVKPFFLHVNYTAPHLSFAGAPDGDHQISWQVPRRVGRRTRAPLRTTKANRHHQSEMEALAARPGGATMA